MTTPASPTRIHPNAVFFLAQAQEVLHLKASTIRREVRLGRLRVAKRAGQYYLLGEWLLEWIKGGELRRQAQPTAAEGDACKCQDDAPAGDAEANGTAAPRAKGKRGQG